MNTNNFQFPSVLIPHVWDNITKEYIITVFEKLNIGATNLNSHAIYSMISGFICVPIFKFIIPKVTLIGPYIEKLDVLLPSIIIAMLAGFIVSKYAK